MAKWWMEIRRIEPTTVMVENRGVGYRCRGGSDTWQRTSCGTDRPPHLAGTGTYLQRHPVSGIELETGASRPADCLDVCIIR